MTISLCTRGGIVEDDGGVLEAVDVVGVLLLGQRGVLVGVARREESRRAREAPARDSKERCIHQSGWGSIWDTVSGILKITAFLGTVS